MKKIIAVLLLGLTILSLSLPTYATETTTPKEKLKKVVKAVRVEQPDHWQIWNARVIAIDEKGMTLTVLNEKGQFTVNAVNAKVVRRYFGQSSFDQIYNKDTVQLRGTWTDPLTLNATYIHDLSIQEYHSIFRGTVVPSSINAKSQTFVLETEARELQTVYVLDTTSMMDNNGGKISFSDIQDGDKIKVDGMWNRVNHTITFTTRLQDKSIPR